MLYTFDCFIYELKLCFFCDIRCQCVEEFGIVWYMRLADLFPSESCVIKIEKKVWVLKLCVLCLLLPRTQNGEFLSFNSIFRYILCISATNLYAKR